MVYGRRKRELFSLVKVSIFLEMSRLSLLPETLFPQWYWFPSFDSRSTDSVISSSVCPAFLQIVHFSTNFGIEPGSISKTRGGCLLFGKGMRTRNDGARWTKIYLITFFKKRIFVQLVFSLDLMRIGTLCSCLHDIIKRLCAIIQTHVNFYFNLKWIFVFWNGFLSCLTFFILTLNLEWDFNFESDFVFETVLDEFKLLFEL